MTEFKKPEVSDKEWIFDLASRSNLHSADFSFGTIYCWAHNINSEIARVGDRLLLRFRFGDKYVYSYPVGSGDIYPAVNAMLEDAESHGQTFTMRGVTRDVLDEVTGLFSEKPEVSFNENHSDYVYSAEKLRTLAGRKLHSKKNHLNRFMADHPDWRFEPITRENIGALHDMASAWFINISDERGTDFLGEIRALHTTFDIYFDAGYDGGIIYEGDNIAAFTIGEMISHDTLVTHFEKASPHINGAYTIINQQFANYMSDKYPELLYINREEDMGIENLRKAKRSYQPEFMVDKFTAVWKK